MKNVQTGAGGAAFHLDVQQQVITDPSGFRINVIRLMQHEGAEHIDAVEELKKIEADTIQPEADAAKNDDGANPEEEADNTDDAEAEEVESVHVARVNFPGEGGVESETQPDKTETTASDRDDVTVVEKIHTVKVELNEEAARDIERKKAAPPESVFSKLRPSEDRYTILERDEL